VSEGPPRIALGVSGGIAAYKAAEIVRGLRRGGADVHVLMTENAQRFITPLTLETLSGHRVLSDPWERGEGSDIQHITLARGLDLLLVAPATADVLARLAHGLADDFLTLKCLRERGVEVIDPVAGELACGEEGVGRMAEPETIVAAVFDRLKKKARGARGRLKGVPSKAAASS